MIDMRISHEAIYQALYIEGRGALKRELVACLRTGRALRKPRERSRNKPQGHVTADVVLSERPAEAEDRAVPGHWEGDLIIGLNRSAIGTVVERSSRYTLLVHLPRLEGYGTIAPVKNGPALGGYGAIAMKDALTTTMTTMPAELLRSLTWDRGKELSAHAQFKVDTGIAVYFADPHSPWQRGTNENTNGLLRQYFPKGTDLSRWDHRRPPRRPGRDQQPTPQSPRLEDASRSPRRAATVAPPSRCCNDRLSPGNIEAKRSPKPPLNSISANRWAEWVPASTMPSRNHSMPRSKSSESTALPTRQGNTPARMWPATSSSATIPSDFTRRWATEPPGGLQRVPESTASGLTTRIVAIRKTRGGPEHPVDQP